METMAEHGRGGEDLDDVWGRIRDGLRRDVGEATFDSWIRPLDFIGQSRGVVTLAAPTRFMRDWVGANFGDRIRAGWGKAIDSVDRVVFVVGECSSAAPEPGGARASLFPERPSPSPGGDADGAGAAPGGGAQTLDSQLRFNSAHDGQRAELPPSSPLDARYTFDRFVVGKANELAHAAARRAAESDGAPFNPLFLYGGVGLGKTHLMHAIAWCLRRQRPDRRVLYLSAEQFMYRFVRALRFKDTISFKQQFRSVDVLMVDDVQFIAGKNSTQEEFFHTFNALIDLNKQIVISADCSPNDLDGVEERIKSRLAWGLVVDIHPADYELRLGILQSKAEEECADHPGLDIDLKVLEFLAYRIVSNVRVMEGALTRLVAIATLVGRPISLDMAQECLSDVIRASDRKVTIDEIMRKVAEHYNLRLSDLLSPRRARAVARPRQMAMYLSKTLTSRSLPEIGRKFGGRDHTTVIHAVKRIEELREIDSEIAEDLELLRRMLEQ